MWRWEIFDGCANISASRESALRRKQRDKRVLIYFQGVVNHDWCAIWLHVVEMRV